MGETKDSFGWKKKTIAAALITVAGLVVALGKSGLTGTIPSPFHLLFAVLAPVAAVIFLFVWNLIEVQAKMYAALYRSASSEIASLRAKLDKFDRSRPDYRIRVTN